ncbi:MAG: dTMP kinase [Acidobacteriota bacterium]
MSFFITFEGVEGCGKTTQARELASHLKTKGYEVFLTREPGGTEIGNAIRRILLDSKNSGMNPYTELYLYLAARVHHIQEVIIPRLERNEIVICDRFSDATKAYQGFARGIPLNFIERLHRTNLHPLKPDLTILLDLSPEIGLKRARERNSSKKVFKEGRFEEEALAFHRKIRKGYLDIAKKERKRIKIVDASGDLEEVRQEVFRKVDEFLKRSGKKKSTVRVRAS